MAAIIAGIYGFGVFIRPDAGASAGFLIPSPAAALAVAAAVISAAAYLKPPQKAMYWVSLGAYILLTAAIAWVVMATGGIASPFIVLWMLAAVFSGLFGAIGIGGLGLLFAVYLVSLYMGVQPPANRELLIAGLAGGLPIVISFLLWHTKSSTEADKEKAFSALAAELSNVASKSEIVINAIADGVIAIDGKGVVQLINPAAQAIIGWGKEDSLNLDYKLILKLTDAKGKELTPQDDPVQQVLFTNKTVVNDDLMLLTNSGKQLLVSVLVSPVGAPGSGAIIVFRDITAQKTEERQQAEFISTASHEMRTPVAAIEGYLGLALNPATAAIDDKARAYLTKAHESAEHLGRLFQDLLDVSKAEDGRLSNNPVVIDLSSMVADIAGSLLPKAQQKGLTLLCKSTSSDGSGDRRIAPVYYTLADRDHVREVVSNLVENAIKYTPQGTVTVDVGGDDSSAIVSIRDTGIGIPPEDIAHLFQKFYRVDNSATREIGGTGLGLYLCRRLVETMNGRIWVESEYGKGSTFLVALPRLSNEEAMARLQQAEAAAAAAQAAAAQSQPAIVAGNYLDPSAFPQNTPSTPQPPNQGMPLP